MAYPWKVLVERKRIKNMYLRVRPDRTVYVTAPMDEKASVIESFVRSREDWIRRAMAAIPEQTEYLYVPGEQHYVFGRQIPLKLFQTVRNTIDFGDDEIRMGIRTVRTDRRKLYMAGARVLLEEEIREQLREWVPRMGVQPAGFTVKAVKSRWGSCNVCTGQLVFALDLVTKPKFLIESVVVHELNHLWEPSHSSRFYKLMDRWLPDYRERKKALSAFPREFM